MTFSLFVCFSVSFFFATWRGWGVQYLKLYKKNANVFQILLWNQTIQHFVVNKLRRKKIFVKCFLNFFSDAYLLIKNNMPFYPLIWYSISWLRDSRLVVNGRKPELTSTTYDPPWQSAVSQLHKGVFRSLISFLEAEIWEF